MFTVKYVNSKFDTSKVWLSEHVRQYRMYRYAMIGDMAKLKVIDTFLVDKGHPNGSEYHLITSKGEILIINSRTYVLCTILIARPGQIKRYYQACGKRWPKWLIGISYRNQKLGLNK